MKLLHPGPEMWPKKFRSDLVYTALRHLEDGLYTIGTASMRWQSTPLKLKARRYWWKFWGWFARYAAHFAFRFRTDRDEMVWYLEELKWRGSPYENNGDQPI